MATDDDILKSLLRIEKALAGSSGSQSSYGAAGTKGSGDGPAIAGRKLPTNSVAAQRKQERDDKQQADQQKKTFKATIVGFNQLEDSTDNLNKTFTGLNKTVFGTRSQFVQLNRSMRSYAKAMGIGSPAIESSPAPSNNNQGGGGNKSGQGQGNGKGKTPDDFKYVAAQGGPLKRFFGSLKRDMFGAHDGIEEADGSIKLFGSGIEKTTGLLVGIGTALKSSIMPVVHDFTALQNAGISARSAMLGLYKDAALAGMSLADYTKLLQNSSATVSRSTSMDDFNQKISGGVKQLEGFGVGLEESTKVSAQLNEFATLSGVAQSDLSSATNPLIKIFGQLQGSVGLSIEQFADMQKTLQESQEVQDALIGTQQQDRAAMLASYTQTMTLGLAMGGTAKQSQELGKALIEQRKLTTPQRYQQGGILRQAGAALGIDPGLIEAGANAVNVKNKTPEQQQAAIAAGSEVYKRIQEMYNSGDQQQVNMAEKLEEQLAPTIEAYKKSAGIGLTASSGPNQGVNKDFAKGADDFTKAVNLFGGIVKGLDANPIASGIINGITTGLTTIFVPGIFKGLGNLFRGKSFFGRAAGAASAAEGAEGAVVAGEAGGKAVGSISSFFKQFSSIEDIAFGLGKRTAQGINAIEDVGNWFKGLFDLQKVSYNVGFGAGKAVNAVEDGVKAFGGFAKSGLMGLLDFLGPVLKRLPLIGSLISGIEEMFTGELADALDPGSVLGRIEGVAVAIFTSIPQMLIDALAFVFGDDAIKPIQHVFDEFKTAFSAGINMIMLGILNAVSWLTDLLPQDSKLRKMVDGAKDTVAASLDANINAMNKLESGNNTTLKEVGDANKKAADVATTTAKASTASITQASNVVTSVDNLTAQALNTAATIATPVTQARTGVTPQDVNTASTDPNAPQNLANPPAQAGALAANPAPDSANLLATAVNILQQMLDIEKSKAEGFNDVMRNLGRPTFTDNVATVAKLAANG